MNMKSPDRSYQILDNLRLENGLYLASSSSDYNYVWLRDSFYEVLPYLDKDCDRYAKTYHRILDLFHSIEWKLDLAINHKPTKQFEYIHSRYNAVTGGEINVEWGHSQHDAIGAVLFGIAEGFKRGKGIIRHQEDRMIIVKIVKYLESCRYWMDSDSGMWEEWREVHSSSVGACVAGLRSIKETGLVRVSDELINRGIETLKNQFPHESADRPADLAQLSLIYPYNLFRRNESKTIIDQVENNLLRSRGVIRYQGDSYYSTKKELGRSLPLPIYHGFEAEWTFGLPWLALCHIQVGNYKKALHYIKRAEEVMLEDGSLPELYFANTNVYNGNTPLGWSNALYIIAKEKYERVVGGV